jgi:hypothetical protein
MTTPMDGDKSHLRVELTLPFIEQPPSLVDCDSISIHYFKFGLESLDHLV